MRKPIPAVATILTALLLAACGKEAAPAPAEHRAITGTRVAVIDTVIVDEYEAAGTAEPMRLATLSTKLMGTVNSVSVQEGDRVVTGQTLVRLDARDLTLAERRETPSVGLAATEESRASEGWQAWIHKPTLGRTRLRPMGR